MQCSPPCLPLQLIVGVCFKVSLSFVEVERVRGLSYTPSLQNTYIVNCKFKGGLLLNSSRLGISCLLFIFGQHPPPFKLIIVFFSNMSLLNDHLTTHTVLCFSCNDFANELGFLSHPDKML